MLLLLYTAIFGGSTAAQELTATPGFSVTVRDRAEVDTARTHINATTWPAIDPQEQVTTKVDFGPALGFGDRLYSVEVSVLVVRGVDATPDLMRVGTAMLKGARVLQRLQGRVSGASYLVKYLATTTQGNVLVLRRVLPVLEQF